MDKNYIDPVIEKYHQLIEEKMPGIFKSFYQGDPIVVPASSLPALIISRAQTRVAAHTNAEDEHDQVFRLTVITDIRAEISDDRQIVPGVAMLYNIIEGREKDTYKLKTDSILGILRSNKNIDTANNLRTDLGQVTRVDYAMIINKRQPDQYALEATVEFIANYVQLF